MTGPTFEEQRDAIDAAHQARCRASDEQRMAERLALEERRRSGMTADEARSVVLGWVSAADNYEPHTIQAFTRDVDTLIAAVQRDKDQGWK